MTWVLISFFAYMVFILVVGLVAGRRTSADMESFYLGDRRAGAWVTAISASASSESGWLVLGCVAMGYIYGFSAFWITVGCVAGFAFNWFFFAERMRSASAACGALTVPEFLERVTGDRTRLVRLIGVVIIFVLMFTYVAAQLNAAGIALQAIFSWHYAVGVLIGAVVTVLYTTIGGYRAVSWTDLWQGLLMAAALVILPVMAFVSLGGADGAEAEIRNHYSGRIHIFQGYVEGEYQTVRIQPGLEARYHKDGTAILMVKDGEPIVRIDGEDEALPLVGEAPSFDLARIGMEGKLKLTKTEDLKGGDDFFSLLGGMAGLLLLGWVVEMLGIGLGYPGSPHVVARFMAAGSATEIARGRVIAMVWAVLAEGGAISMGILARGLLPDLADPQAGLLATAQHFLPPVLVGLIVAAVFAALRSTADSQLLVASSAVVRDFYEGVLGKKLTGERAMRISRVVVLVLGALAIAFALSENRFIFWFVLFSWAGLGASFAPPLILAVYWKRLSAAGVIAAMVTGFGTTLLWKLYLRALIVAKGGPDIYELVPAFFASLLAAVVFSLLMPRRSAT